MVLPLPAGKILVQSSVGNGNGFLAEKTHPSYWH